MKKFSSSVLLVLLLAAQAGAFDFPQIHGWTPLGEPAIYTPDNLYEYINGAADQFIDYGLVLLHTRELSAGAVQVALDIYDMGNRLNAFGMYKTERPADRPLLAIGSEAVISPPYQCLLLKDQFYVKVNVFGGEITGEMGTQLLTAVARALPGQAGLPAELALLPADGKIPGSEAFAKNNYLGRTDLTDCLYAGYRDGESAFQYFVLTATPDSALDARWNSLAAQWTPAAQPGRSILIKKIPYKGLIGVVKLEDRIIGVTDCSDEGQVIRRLTKATTE
ncbi:MAG: DUF6599 family protein [Candidatus Zhuqueibacterota bacterium]